MGGARDWFARCAVVGALALTAAPAQAAAPLTGVDLSTYVRVGRHDLPTQASPANLLAQEASAVTYDWDTNTLFVVGDGGTSVVQVDKAGHLIDSMTLAGGNSPQGTEFYDTEAIAYVGGGKFVLGEERYRQVNLFTYVPSTTLNRADVKTVKLGTTIGNTGIEGLSNDPFSGGFLVVKEIDPEGIFQTGIDFAAGTATNGSPTTLNSTNLFDPALAGLADFSDVFSLSNLTTLTGPDASHLLILSQEAGRIVNVDRAGHVSSSLTIAGDADNPLAVPDQSHEGLTMDNDGFLYTVSEAGGGDSNHPQLWVYAPSTAQNAPPTGVSLTNQVTSLPSDTSTATRVKVADVNIADDGLGTNNLAVTGPDASAFEVDQSGLYLKAGTALSHAGYTVSVTVDDPSSAASPDATSAPFALTIAAPPAPPKILVTEVSPWSSGDAPYKADWWELTNAGTQAVDLTGWKMDDSSNQLASAVALNGVPSLAPGGSAVFLEGSAATTNAFKTAWFGSAVPAGFAIGFYSGSGVGLSTDGDAVNIFDAKGNRITGVSFGASTTGFTFEYPAGVGMLSVAGRNGAFVAADGTETGSPGRVAAHASGTATGTVPATLSLTVGGPATFAPFVPGVANDYTATLAANVISSAGDATLTAADSSANNTGHLVNGTFALAQPLQVAGQPVTSPVIVKTYTAPVSNDQVTIGLTQPIAATDALRTGTYAKTLTFTLSTTTP